MSAQQARERKKVYVNDLESRAKELEDANFNLEEKISTLLNENTMLRKVMMDKLSRTFNQYYCKICVMVYLTCESIPFRAGSYEYKAKSRRKHRAKAGSIG